MNQSGPLSVRLTMRAHSTGSGRATTTQSYWNADDLSDQSLPVELVETVWVVGHVEARIAADVERQLDATGLGPPFGDFRSLLAPIAGSLRVDLKD